MPIHLRRPNFFLVGPISSIFLALFLVSERHFMAKAPEQLWKRTFPGYWETEGKDTGQNKHYREGEYIKDPSSAKFGSSGMRESASK